MNAVNIAEHMASLGLQAQAGHVLGDIHGVHELIIPVQD